MTSVLLHGLLVFACRFSRRVARARHFDHDGVELALHRPADDRLVGELVRRPVPRPPLRNAGAEQVFAGEGEVALVMTEAVLRRLGATPDQIDRERDRVRAELFGGILTGRLD